MSTKAYYPISEIGAGKVGFSRTRSIIEGAFYGNNVVKVNTLKEAYELAKNSPGTVVTDMPVRMVKHSVLRRMLKFFFSMTVLLQAVMLRLVVSRANPVLMKLSLIK